MKTLKRTVAFALALSILGSPLAGLASDQTADGKPKPKPYPLKTCVVTDEKLGEMGDGYVFVHEGRENQALLQGLLEGLQEDPPSISRRLRWRKPRPRPKSN